MPGGVLEILREILCKVYDYDILIKYHTLHFSFLFPFSAHSLHSLYSFYLFSFLPFFLNNSVINALHGPQKFRCVNLIGRHSSGTEKGIGAWRGKRSICIWGICEMWEPEQGGKGLHTRNDWLCGVRARVGWEEHPLGWATQWDGIGWLESGWSPHRTVVLGHGVKAWLKWGNLLDILAQIPNGIKLKCILGRESNWMRKCVAMVMENLSHTGGPIK